MAMTLAEFEGLLTERDQLRAEHEGWAGEVNGLRLPASSLAALRRDQAYARLVALEARIEAELDEERRAEELEA